MQGSEYKTGFRIWDKLQIIGPGSEIWWRFRFKNQNIDLHFGRMNKKNLIEKGEE